MMRPVHLFWSEDVTKEEVQLAIKAFEGVNKLLPLLPEEVLVLYPHDSNTILVKNPKWTIKQVIEWAWIKERGQANAPGIIQHFQKLVANQREPIYAFIIVGCDVTSKGEKGWDPFQCGMSDGESVGLVSTNKFKRKARDKHIYDLYFSRSVQHEFLHILGLFTKQYCRDRNVDHSCRGLPHCANELCIMREAESFQKMMEDAQEAERKGIILCSDCQRDLLRLVTSRTSGDFI